MTHENNYDVVVVGAGAAGLMAAITAREGGLSVLLLDGQPKIGAKILMSGGTRCNVTNVEVTEKDYSSEKITTVRNILRFFTSPETIKFFERLGVEFVLEEGGKYFPTTHSGKTILDVLLKEINRLGVDLKYPCKVRKISKTATGFLVDTIEHKFAGKSVVLCTGGLSYPSTGSDGIGYSLAQIFGHKMIQTTAALTPLTTSNEYWMQLSGIAMDSVVTLWVDNKKYKEFSDPFLFTHFGFSGSCILNISRFWIRLKSKHQCRITVNFFPKMPQANFDQELVNAQKTSKKSIKNYLAQYFPERFVVHLLNFLKIDGDKVLPQLTKENRKKIIEQLYSFELPVKNVFGYSKAEVTAGGIDFNDIDSHTLESKLQPNLYFAGEIVDVDGRIGGFNFQWAFASGRVVGNDLIKKIKSKS